MRGALGKLFGLDAEPKQKRERSAVLNAELDIDGKHGAEIEGKEATRQISLCPLNMGGTNGLNRTR